MKNATRKHGLKIALAAGGLLVLIPTVYGQGMGLQTLERMQVATPQTLERGAEIYDVQCASCHGDQGQGGAALGERLGAQGFVGVEVERSGLESIVSVISHGIEYDDELEDGEEAPDRVDHPVFENLFFQDQWAVAHYVHSLIDDPRPSPPEVVARIREEAEFGVCDPDIRAGIADFIEPSDDAQIEAGRQEYSIQCVSCHGAEGLGDGPAGAAVGARNFHDDPDEWVNGTSALALFNSLQAGVGNNMPSYAHLPDETVWNLVYYMQAELIPEENIEELTDAQIDEACRALSAPPRPPSIPIEKAMEFLAMDAEEDRMIRRMQYGDPLVAADADATRGQEIYTQSCASCHGAEGSSNGPLGPYGTFPPFLFLDLPELVPASAGGTYQDLAGRTLGGPHSALPDMFSVVGLNDQDWKDLQAYLASLPGEGSDRVRVYDPTALPEDEDADEESLEAEEALDEDTDAGEETTEVREEPDSPAPQEEPETAPPVDTDDTDEDNQ